MTGLILISSGLAMAANAAEPPRDTRVVFARISAPGKTPIEELFREGNVDTAPGAQTVKLVIAFDRPTEAAKIAIDSCSGDFKDGTEFQYWPSQGRSFVEGGRKSIVTTIPRDGDPMTTLSINFGYEADLCLKNLRFLSADDKAVNVRAPLAVPAALGSGTSELFDSRPDTSASIPAEGPGLKIVFDSTQTIEGVVAWNGDQASRQVYQASKRAPSLIITGDENFSETIALRDAPGAQEHVFKRKFKGRQLVVKSASAGLLSELRFLDTHGIIYPRDARLPEPSEQRQLGFANEGLSEALDRELGTRQEDENWTFRFRSDGTFFVRGNSASNKSASQFTGLGGYEIVKSSRKSSASERKVQSKRTEAGGAKSGGEKRKSAIASMFGAKQAPREKHVITLKLKGLRRTMAAAWDGWICGLACGDQDHERGDPINDTIVIEKIGAGGLMLRNRTPNRVKGLPFTDLRVKVNSLAE